MDSESAKLFVSQIRAKREAINSLVSRIQKVQAVQRRIMQEREKAKQNHQAAEKLRNIARNALAILERPPCASLIFDNFGNQPEALGQYDTRMVKISDIVDLGERIQDPGPPNDPQNSILHIKWQDAKDRIPKPQIFPHDKEVGFNQEILFQHSPELNYQ